MMRYFSKTADSDNDSSLDVISHGLPTELSSTDVGEKQQTSVDSHILEDIRKLQKSHQNDPNLSQEEVEALQEAAKTGDAEKVFEVEKEFTESMRRSQPF